MKRIATNTLTGWAFALFASYWVIASMVPGDWLAVGVRIALFGFSAAALRQWGPSALNILRERETPADAKGDVFSLLGIAGIAGGMAYQSLWGAIWYAYGRPLEWTSTSHSMFGWFVMAVSLALLYRSTTIKNDIVQPVRWWVFAVIVLAVGLAAFFLGSKWQESLQASAAIEIVHARNECPDKTPVAGNKGRAGWVYHMPGGPYYSQTVPEACFGTEGEAIVAGYRPAGR